MQSPSVRKILKASLELSEEQGIDKKEAMNSILCSMQELKKVWNQILLKEGVESLISKQYR